MKRTILLLLIFSLFLPSEAETVIFWEAHENDGNFSGYYDKSYALCYIEDTQEVMYVHSSETKILANNWLTYTPYSNRIYMPYNTTHLYFSSFSFSIYPNMYSFHDPISNEYFFVDHDFKVLRFNDTYYHSGWDTEGLIATYINYTNIFEDFYKPIERTSYDMAYDYQHRNIVLFGGYNGKTLGDTWIFSIEERRWYQVTPEIHPSRRSGHAMVFHPDGSIYLMGTAAESKFWKFNSESEIWTELPNQYDLSSIYTTLLYDTYNEKILAYQNSILYAINEITGYWTYIGIGGFTSEYYNGHWIMMENTSLILGSNTFYELHLDLHISQSYSNPNVTTVTETTTVGLATTTNTQRITDFTTEISTVTDAVTDTSTLTETIFDTITLTNSSSYNGNISNSTTTPIYLSAIIIPSMVLIVIKRMK
ncbi:MAG: hypothetical protein INQ03_09015 [Candidatus Heimdallarchaeota archaeon]|nr:hypothetical protein [Candidatus Heimdallarchaeota archaeon]